MGNQSCGVHIPGMGAAGSRRSADTVLGPSKGKEKIASSGLASKLGSWLASSDNETSSKEIVPVERKRRLVRSDGSSVDGLLLPGQKAPKM
jgi:hypothetical protein